MTLTFTSISHCGSFHVTLIPHPSPGLVISQAQIICHQNDFVLRNTDRSDNARGKGQSFVIFSVLFLNQYMLTAFLFTKLLVNQGEEVRNFCKFSSLHPPTQKLCLYQNETPMLTGMSHWLAGQCPQLQGECCFQALLCWSQFDRVVKAAMPSGRSS